MEAQVDGKPAVPLVLRVAVSRRLLARENIVQGTVGKDATFG